MPAIISMGVEKKRERKNTVILFTIMKIYIIHGLLKEVWETLRSNT